MAGQQDGAGAGAEDRLLPREFEQFIPEPFPLEQDDVGRTLPTGQDQTVDFAQLARVAHVGWLGAELGQPLRMRLKVALQGQHPDLHREFRAWLGQLLTGTPLARRWPLPATRLQQLALVKACHV